MNLRDLNDYIFCKLINQYQSYKERIDAAIHDVIDKSNYIMGSEADDLESLLQSFTESKYSIISNSVLIIFH
jgi:UDP-2-acetamido-2-deoxy-ribo-hexuluronate aminotransferase